MNSLKIFDPVSNRVKQVRYFYFYDNFTIDIQGDFKRVIKVQVVIKLFFLLMLRENVQKKNTINDSASGSNIIMFQWEIKVTQYECDELIAPKLDCLQYHTSPSGDLNSIFKSFYDGKVKLSLFKV